MVVPGLPVAAHAAAQAAMAAASGVRAMSSGVPSWRRRAAAKAAAADMRSLLRFAEGFDPYRQAKRSLAATLGRLGWEVNAGELISDGLAVDFTMRDSFCAFELGGAAHYLPPGAPGASTTPAAPPAPRDPATGLVLPPAATPFPAAPASWQNPVAGMVLDAATVARHELIRSKGWNLVAVPEAAWAAACALPDPHYARRDYLLSLTLPLAPFEPRPVSATKAVTVGEEGASSAAAAAAADDGGDTVAAARARATGTSNRAKRRADQAVEAAKEREAARARRDKLMGVSSRVVGRTSSASRTRTAAVGTEADAAAVAAAEEAAALRAAAAAGATLGEAAEEAADEPAAAGAAGGAGGGKKPAAAAAPKPRRKESGGGFRR